MTMIRLPLRLGFAVALGFGLMQLTAFTTKVDASDGTSWHHGSTLHEPLRYEKGFSHLPYANPDAPKGGVARLSARGTFDTFNPAPPKGSAGGLLGLVYETLFHRTLDVPDEEYGLLADGIQFPKDFAWVKVHLNPDARWHDGKPVTPEDVVWSFEKLTELSPQQKNYYRHVTKAEVSGDGEILFTFDETGNRELPTIVTQLMVLPKHWWTANDADGNPRDIAKASLELPLGSGPYRLDSYVAGRNITYKRAENYWGANLNVNVGHNNFDKIKLEYFRDDTALFEAFKSDVFDVRYENTAKTWATQYDFPAMNDGRVIKHLIDQKGSGLMVGFILNLRKPMFQDIRIRKGLNLLYDFEDLNEALFYNSYVRYSSYFHGSDLASRGKPEDIELALLEPHRENLPAALFEGPYINPINKNRKDIRNHQKQALKLFVDAGWKLEGNQMLDQNGKPVKFEYLISSPSFERIGIRLQKSFGLLGIKLKLYTPDSSQYTNRVRNRDYDMIYTGWGQSLSPGNEQLEYWGTESAEQNASRNYAGIKDPVVDDLIDKLIFAKDRKALEAATSALDRVLLWRQYVLPGWGLFKTRMARWDRFSHPEPLPEGGAGYLSVWWYDKDKAAVVAAKQ